MIWVAHHKPTMTGNGDLRDSFLLFGSGIVLGNACFLRARCPTYFQHFGAGSCHFNCLCNILELEPLMFHRICGMLVELCYLLKLEAAVSTVFSAFLSSNFSCSMEFVACCCSNCSCNMVLVICN